MKHLKKFENFLSYNWGKHQSQITEEIKDIFEMELGDEKLFSLMFEENRSNSSFYVRIPLQILSSSAKGEDPTAEEIERSNRTPIYYSDGKKAKMNKFGTYLPEENRNFLFTFNQVSEFILRVVSLLEESNRFIAMDVAWSDRKNQSILDWTRVNLNNTTDLEMLNSKKIESIKVTFHDSAYTSDIFQYLHENGFNKMPKVRGGSAVKYNAEKGYIKGSGFIRMCGIPTEEMSKKLKSDLSEIIKKNPDYKRYRFLNTMKLYSYKGQVVFEDQLSWLKKNGVNLDEILPTKRFEFVILTE